MLPSVKLVMAREGWDCAYWRRVSQSTWVLDQYWLFNCCHLKSLMYSVKRYKFQVIL